MMYNHSCSTPLPALSSSSGSSSSAAAAEITATTATAAVAASLPSSMRFGRIQGGAVEKRFGLREVVVVLVVWLCIANFWAANNRSSQWRLPSQEEHRLDQPEERGESKHSRSGTADQRNDLNIDDPRALKEQKPTKTRSMSQSVEQASQQSIPTDNAAAAHIQSSPAQHWLGKMITRLADTQHRLVILIASCGYVDFVENCVISMQRLNVTNFCIVPMDAQAEQMLRRLYPNHVTTIPPFVKSRLVKKPLDIGKQDFKQLTSTRPTIITTFLQLGLKVFYCDIDVVWRRHNALDFLDLSAREEGEEHLASFLLPPQPQSQPRPQPTFAISNGHDHDHGTARYLYDIVAMVDSGQPQEGKICTGMLYMLPTENTIAFLRQWQKTIDTGHFQNDQYAMYETYQQQQEQQGSTKIRLYPNNNPHFPNGRTYAIWKQRAQYQSQQDGVLLVHNNFISGKSRKFARFRMWQLWFVTDNYSFLRKQCAAG